jgi:iron complex transport system substrate-binding protein
MYSQHLYAQRLISTSPAITQTLESLKLSKSIVGVSSYCIFNKKVARIGTSFTIDWEKILKLKPDFLLLQKVKNSSNVKKATNINIKVKEYEFRNVDTLRSSIITMGRDFHSDTKKIIANLDKIITLITKVNFNKKVLGIVSLNQKMDNIVSVTSIGNNNYYNDLFNYSGVNNVIKKTGYPNLSIERVLKLDVDYIFIFSPNMTVDLENKFKKITNKKLIVWRDYESQEVGTLFIKFMRAFYEKISS